VIFPLSHPQAVLSHLSEQRSQGLFCDVIIVVEDVKFRAHRNILAATSGYFHNAFKTPEVYTSSQVLELTDLKSEVFASILNFIYNARVESSSTEDSRSLVAAGKRLGIPFLEKLLDSERQSSGLLQGQASAGRSNSQPKLADTCTLKKETLKPEELDCSKGPRITNAFSITEVEAVNNPFTTLDHRDKVTEGLEEGHLPSSSQDTSISPTESEPANALTEHSYAKRRIHGNGIPPLSSEPVCAKSLKGPSELETNNKDCLRVPVSNGASNANTTQHSLRPPDLHIPLNLEPTLTSPLEMSQDQVNGTLKTNGTSRTYKCSVCKRAYVTLSSLKRHENVHSWHRAYPCHYCNKVFALAEYRTKHEIWHTGERRYQCIFCLETFLTYYILKNHQKTFHGIDPQLAVNKKSMLLVVSPYFQCQ
uniref:Zinc finger and BTB domain containing 38 n=1 Tax=Cyprinus carpio TaxID=7962 RepID=A0A8C1VXL5_CYPCA